jgi:Tfp pilus assembly protein PilX
MFIIMTRNQAQNRVISRKPSALPAGQRGAVLLIALVVLVAMTLSALALIRAVNTTNLVAGNFAFRESAVLSAEQSLQAALNWLSSNNGTIAGTGGSVQRNPMLYNNHPADGYYATRQDPTSTWDAFWKSIASTGGAPRVVRGGQEDVAGNTVSYVIHRLCKTQGAPKDATCVEPPDLEPGQAGLPQPIEKNRQIYYRITTRVDGPRNTVAYTQTFIAL